MEGEIRGRRGERFLIDKRFLAQSLEKTIRVGDLTIEIRVPGYKDFFVLKLLSARPSDIRDIATLAWKHQIPNTRQLVQRASEAVAEPGILAEKLEIVISDTSDPRFPDSWRGTLITKGFREGDRKEVLEKLRGLRANL